MSTYLVYNHLQRWIFYWLTVDEDSVLLTTTMSERLRVYRKYLYTVPTIKNVNVLRMFLAKHNDSLYRNLWRDNSNNRNSHTLKQFSSSEKINLLIII